MIDILSTSGELLLEVPILEDAVSHEELMGQDYVQLSWSSSTGDVLPAGTYIIHNNEKYFLLEPHTPAVVSEVEYKYRPQFHSSVDTWDKHPACVYAYSEDGSVASKQFDWTFTGAPSDAMHIVVQAIAEETGESWTARIADSLPATIELTCQANSIRSILSSIADQCETEYWVDKPSKTLYLSRCSKGEALSLRIGKDIGVPSITTPKEGYYTRYYALGSTRNIPQGSNNSSYIANQRLTLSPTVYPYGYKDVKGHFSGGQFVSDLKPNEIFSKVVIFDDIYPSSKLKITNVRPRLKYRLMDGGEKVVIGGTEEEPIYDQYAVWYFQIENFEFKEETVIKGQELSVHFNNGQLAGRDFSLAYHAEAKEVFTDGDVAKFQIEAGDYEILFVEEGGMVIPSLTYIVPVEGDSVTLFNINMPTEYINAAMSDLEDAVNKKIAEEEGDHNTYEFDSFPTAFHKKKIDVALGRVVSIVDADGKKSTSTRVTMVEKHLDCGSVQRIRCSKKVAKSNTVQVKESLTSVNNNLDVIKAFNEMSEAIYESYARTQAKINEALLRISDMFFWMDEDKTTIGTKFNFVSEKQIAAGGVIGSGDGDGGGDGEGDGTGEGFLLINSWPVSGDYSSYALGANLGIELNERLKRIEDGEITPDLTGYATQDWVLERGYLTSADLSGYALKSDVDALKEFFDGVEDQDALINKWHELEDFLAGVEEGDKLLAMVANNDTQISNLTKWVTALDKDVTEMKGLVEGFDTRITYFEDMFEWVLDDNGNRIAIRAKSNFFSEHQVAAGGIGESIGLGSGGGITGIVVNGQTYNEPDEMGVLTLPNYPTSLLWSNIEDKPSFAAVATSGSYNDLTDKPAIPSLSGYATQQWVLSQGFAVASSLGNLAYKDGISWSEVSGRPTKLSDFTDDILSGKYLPIGGNAASATKLATARTIWGQSFDGTGDVSGDLYLEKSYIRGIGNKSILGADSVYNIDLGYGCSESGGSTFIHGKQVALYRGTSHTLGFLLNSSGNVTIGSSDLAGTDYKFVVNGLSRFKNNVESDGNVIGAGAVYAKTSAHGFVSLQVGSTGNKGLLDSRTSWIIYTDGANTFLPQGHVGIGTTDPQYKLDVNGIARASGLIGNNVCIACGSDGTTSGYSGEINRFGGGNLYIQGREGGLMLGFDGNTTTVRGMLVVNRDVTIGNSTSGTIRIGGATLSWDDANKALKIDTGLYSLGQIAAGGIGTESEGSGSGTIGLLFDSTKTWAEYTSDMADYALAAYHGKALNDRLVAVEAKAGDYLPITGGTMTGNIQFSAVDAGILDGGGYKTLGLSSNGVNYYLGSPQFSTKIRSNADIIATIAQTDYTLIHSGNVGSYAFVPRTRIASNTDADTLLTNGVYLNETGNGSGNNNFPAMYSILMSFAQSNSFAAQISIGYDSMHVRRKINTWSDWKTVAFTDSNVASATKLADDTAFTAWGQTFFKNGKPVSISQTTSLITPLVSFRNMANDGQAGYIGRGNPSGEEIILYSNTFLRFYTNGAERIRIAGNGNVGIGTTDPQYKLDVNGTGRFQNELTLMNPTGLRWAYGNYGTLFRNDGANFYILFTNSGEALTGSWNSLRPFRVSLTTGDITMEHSLTVSKQVKIGAEASINNRFVMFAPYAQSQGVSFGYMKPTIANQYNVGMLHIGTNYGGTNNITDTATDMGAISIYRSTVGIGKEYTYEEIRAIYNAGADLGVNKGIKIGSAVLSWDSTNNALKIEGNVYATGQVASGGIGEEGDNIATYNKWGGLKPAYSTTGKATLTTTSQAFTNSPTIAVRTTTAGRYYAVEMDAVGRAFVNVPWVNTNYWTLDSSVSRIYPADTARQLCVGGTGSSAYSTSLYKLVVHGSAFAISGAWQSSSDMTMKDVVKDIDLDIKDIANAPSFAFTWKGSEDKTEWLGTSAQYWKTILPTAVKGEEGSYSLSYGELALTTAIAIAKKTMNHEERIKELELQVKTLKDRLSVYEN